MSAGDSPGRPGPLVAIGGAEDKVGRRSVLHEFVARAGGDAARIAVVPTASSLGPEILDRYLAMFRALGAEAVGARPETRDQADDHQMVRRLEGASGIFMTGGNQLKLSQVIAGTRFGQAILEANAAGAVVGGTSAGASILSSHMVAFGSGGATPKQRMTQLAAGLGLVRSCIIDQHFDQRNRYGRLMMLVAQSPSLLGLGVDEDTAAVISDGHLLGVSGRGSVTILDGSRVRSNAHEAKRTAPLLVSGAILHVLPAGSLFDLTTRSLLAAPSSVVLAEPGEEPESVSGVNATAQDIASFGRSPSGLGRRRRRRPSHRQEGERQ